MSGDALDELHRLMIQASRLPDGLEQLDCVEKAVALAEELGELELQFELQLKVAQAAFNCGQLQKTIVAVAWCFGMQDRFPDRFSYELLLSICTYAMNSLSSLPTSTRGQIAELIDNIEQRYVEAGYSLRAVYRARCFNALWMGDAAEADRARERMKDCPIDFTFEGETWELLFEVDYLIQRGRIREGIEASEPILRAEDDAHGAYCWLASFVLLPLLQMGEAKAAATAQRRSQADVLQNPSFAECVGHHILYFVATGQVDGAVRLFDRCVGWALDSPLLRESFELALAGWACVRRLRHLDAAVWPGSLPADYASQLAQGELSGMESVLESFVVDSAKRFDERNGNSHYADLIRYRVAVAELSWKPALPEE